MKIITKQTCAWVHRKIDVLLFRVSLSLSLSPVFITVPLFIVGHGVFHRPDLAPSPHPRRLQTDPRHGRKLKWVFYCCGLSSKTCKWSVKTPGGSKLLICGSQVWYFNCWLILIYYQIDWNKAFMYAFTNIGFNKANKVNMS